MDEKMNSMHSLPLMFRNLIFRKRVFPTVFLTSIHMYADKNQEIHVVAFSQTLHHRATLCVDFGAVRLLRLVKYTAMYLYALHKQIL